MKLVSIAFFLVALLISLLVPVASLLLPVFFGAAFGAYGIAKSFARHLDPLNDVPNAFRVFLASLAGYLVTLTGIFIFPSAGILLLVAALYLNDEFQRRTIDSVRRGRRGGSIALLGIDGSGKSSHSTVTSGWLERRGYRVELMPFHKYLFVERLSSISSAVRGGSSNSSSSSVSSKRRNPLRPVLSLADNLLLQISTSLGCRIEGTVVVYDRFIWSTYIKYEALGYPVRPLAFLYLLPRPYFAIVLDVPVDKSLKVIDERVAHIHYPRSVLQHEREVYLQIARRNGYPVIDATSSFDDVQAKIESHLISLFPQVSGAHPR